MLVLLPPPQVQGLVGRPLLPLVGGPLLPLVGVSPLPLPHSLVGVVLLSLLRTLIVNINLS